MELQPNIHLKIYRKASYQVLGVTPPPQGPSMVGEFHLDAHKNIKKNIFSSRKREVSVHAILCEHT